MTPTLPNVLDKARQGRAAATHLRALVETSTLTEADGKRLVAKILAGFDAVLGPAADPRPQRPTLTPIDGGRA